MRNIQSLAKFIIEKGYDKNGNGTDKRVVALLNSLARKPDNLRHRKYLWRIVMPQMIERAFVGDPFLPYPTQDEFEGEIEVGVIGICEAFKLELKNAVTGNQAHSS